MSNEARAKSWYPNFTLAYTTTGAPAVVKTFPVASGETVTVGMPVVLTADELVPATDTSGELYGIAAGYGDAGDDVMVYVGDFNTVFMGRADDATDNVGNLPALCDIVESDGHWRANIGDNTEDVIQIVDIVHDDDTSDTSEPGRVYFKIHRSQYNGVMGAK